MAAMSESRVSVRFFGDELDPAELTELLGCEPSIQYKRGDTHLSAGREYTRKWGAWVVAAETRKPEAVDEQLTELFARMTQDLAVWRDLASRFDGDVFCGLFMAESNEGFSISPATLEALASRALEIGFDIYDPDKDPTLEAGPQ
jgi:hypothetical protein